ncbi:hypothetical protein L7F22_060366 [Adiantum nelumboides]|nr:hypothetical protein [Adiantum nelumboides]
MFSKNAVQCIESYGDFSKLWKGEGLAAALRAAQDLQQKGLPLSIDFVRCIIQGCLKKKDLRSGKQAHLLVISYGLLSYNCLAAELIRFFAACHYPPGAYRVFHNLPLPSLYTCNCMISAQISFSDEEAALCLYETMCLHGTKPDRITFLHAFKACGNVGYKEKGRIIHGDVLRSSCHCDAIVGSAIIDMYVKCGVLEDATKVFNGLPRRDAVLWGSMIAGHALHGSSLKALDLFASMGEHAHKPNQIILSSVLTACGNIGAIQQGRLIHDQIIVNNGHPDTVLGNTLVDMYVRCGSIDEALKVFHGLSARDLASWSCLITGYAQQGDGFSALQLFDQLTEQGTQLDKITYLCLLKACTKVGGLLHGMRIHEGAIRNGFDRDQVVGSSLLDMYVKCGYLKEAIKVLEQLMDPDVVSWSTMVTGFAQAGDWFLTFSFLDNMRKRGMQPDGVTFASILKACSQTGVLTEAYEYFNSMRLKHNIIPNNEQYNCMVDLLSRTGQLCDAEDLVSTVPVSSNMMQSTSLLTSCRTYSNMNYGRQHFDLSLKMNPD